jgi:type IV fimbrial biogenesis protein FimT
MPLSSHRGFTLLELMIVCAIAALLAGLATPSFNDFLLNARRTEQVNGLLRALHLARGAAIREGEAVVLCKSRNGLQCTTDASPWTEGWIAFANRDRDSPPQVDANEPIFLRQPRIENLSVRANRNAVTYWPFSLAGTTASFVICDKRGPPAARSIVVSQTGRPRVTQSDSSGRPLSCP